MYDFTKFKTIQSFGDVTRNRIDLTNDEQKELAKKSGEFASNTWLRNLNIKNKKCIENNALALLKGR